MDLITALQEIGLDPIVWDERGPFRPERRTPAEKGEQLAAPTLFKRYIVFEVGGIADAAAFRAWALGPNGLAFKSLMGSWRGRHNPAFITEDSPGNRLKLAYWLREQDAILCLGPAYRDGPAGKTLYGNREAILDWLDRSAVERGYAVERREPQEGMWQAVSKETALRQKIWTFDPTENQYYAVV